MNASVQENVKRPLVGAEGISSEFESVSGGVSLSGFSSAFSTSLGIWGGGTLVMWEGKEGIGKLEGARLVITQVVRVILPPTKWGGDWWQEKEGNGKLEGARVVITQVVPVVLPPTKWVLDSEGRKVHVAMR